MYWLVPILLLGSLSPVVLAQSFENTAIVRTVDLGGSLVHVTTTYAVKALKAGEQTYKVSLGLDAKRKTSWIDAKIKGTLESLEVEDLGIEPFSKVALLAVSLPKKTVEGEAFNLVLETVQTHATRPWPETAGQTEDQSLKYDSELFITSPYHTKVQRTKLKSPTPKIHSYTTPEGLDAFTFDAPVSKSGATITYGPYNNVEPSTNTDFAEKVQKDITVHYSYDQPVLEITKYKRLAEVSHWGANLNIQDEIHLHNAGPALKGHFSRLEHQSQAFFQRAAPQVISSLALHLPAGIRNTYYYDLIGNVSTSKLRVAPSPASLPKHFANKNQYSILEMKPRYPLMGGWNYSFTLGWDSPLEDSVKYDSSKGKYYLQVPIMTQFPGAVADDVDVTIILPEGAGEIDVFRSFKSAAPSMRIHQTYLDSKGRPAITFKYNQLTDKHNGIIYVSYQVPLLMHLRKPFVVSGVVFGFFVFTIFARRLSFKIHAHPHHHKKTL